MDHHHEKVNEWAAREVRAMLVRVMRWTISEYMRRANELIG